MPDSLLRSTRHRYGGEHAAPELQAEAVYGLTELYREQVRGARLVANPGCYPTSVQLPLAPLLTAGLILKDDIIIDAKSGACVWGGWGGSAACCWCLAASAERCCGCKLAAHMRQKLAMAAPQDVCGLLQQLAAISCIARVHGRSQASSAGLHHCST